MLAFAFFALSVLTTQFGSDRGGGAAKPDTQQVVLEDFHGARCEVHGNPLYKGDAPLICGRFRAPDEKAVALEEAAERFFPHAKVTVYGGCIEKKAKVAQALFCPNCRMRREEWLKNPTHVAKPRPLEEAYKDIKIGMTEEELFAMMAPYKRLYTEHGQWQSWEDGHTGISVTLWPKGDFLSRHPDGWGPFYVRGSQSSERCMTSQKGSGSRKRSPLG